LPIALLNFEEFQMLAAAVVTPDTIPTAVTATASSLLSVSTGVLIDDKLDLPNEVKAGSNVGNKIV
jgi:hypothetical protein